MADETNQPTPEAAAPEATGEKRGGRGRRGGGERGDRGDRGPRRDRREERDEGEELIEKLVAVNRVAKVVKGGKRFGFAAIVVIGDGKGRVGYGTAKAREVPDAIKKATDYAKRKMIRVAMREGRTLHHDIIGHYGAGKVVLRAAPAGTGVIAGGAQRAIFEALGIQDVVAKSIGTTNPHNLIKATFAALQKTQSPRLVAQRRGKKVAELFGKVEGNHEHAAAVGE
jgi:small subunit ribosomal protein S5